MGGFFLQRVVRICYETTEEVVEVDTVLKIRRHLDSYIGKTGLEGVATGFGSNHSDIRSRVN